MAWLARLLVLLAFAACMPAFGQQPIALGPTTVRFATLAEAREEMAREDDWMAAAGAFQRSAALKVERPVTLGEFREALARAALDWTPQEAQRWERAVRALVPRFDALGIRLPPTVLLVLNDGSTDELPHTRGQAIFLPRGLALAQPDEDVMAHELFHVLSRHDPALATRIYALYGFEPAPPLEWPHSWEAVRLANPDAPLHRHAIAFQHEGRAVRAMPVLVARSTRLAPGQTIMDVLDVRLLLLAPHEPGSPSRALLKDGGEPEWLPAFRTPAYIERTGRNTGYLFHPEEIAADNFTLLVNGRPARNPGLLRQLETLLREAANTPERKQ